MKNSTKYLIADDSEVWIESKLLNVKVLIAIKFVLLIGNFADD